MAIGLKNGRRLEFLACPLILPKVPGGHGITDFDPINSRARNKASRLTGHLVAITLTQGILVHLCPDK